MRPHSASKLDRIRRPLLLALLCAAAALAQPGAAKEVLKRAIALHQAGDAASAIPFYEQYVKLKPDSVLALSNLGAAYSRTGRYPDAITRYKQALKIQPDNLSVEMNLGLAYYKTGQMDRAAAIFEKLHRLAPDQAQPLLLLADTWLAMGKYKEVDELLTPRFNKNPDDLAVTYMLGTALVRGGQAERGQVIIDRILRRGDSAEARLLLGVTKLNANDYPAALIDLSKAVELNPELPDVHAYHGQALLATGDPAAAAEAFRKALSANTNSFVANLELGVLLKGEQKWDDAMAHLQKALLMRPEHLDTRYQIATIALQQGRSEQARLQLEQIVKEAPGYTEAHVTLATVYYRLKRKADGDRERAIVQKLTEEAQAKQQKGMNVK